MYRKITAGFLVVTLAVSVGCGSLQKASYDSKADGSSKIKVAGESKDGKLKYNLEDKTAPNGLTTERSSFQYDSTATKPRN